MSLSNEFSFNLARYFSRIGFEYNAAEFIPNLENLIAIENLHLHAIPFENLDVVQKKLISMASDDVEKKLVVQQRGGYCFELNTLFQTALTAAGYKVTPMLARVRYNKHVDVITTFTHIILNVTTPADQTEYLVDVGFGGIGPNTPLRLDTEDLQQTSDGLYRLTKCPFNYRLLSWYVKDTWIDLFTFPFEGALECDLQAGNWWSCTHPTAKWVNCLFAARLVNNDKHYILNNEYNIRKQVDGTMVSVSIGSVDTLVSLLDSVFGLDFSTQLSEEHFRNCCQVFLNASPASK